MKAELHLDLETELRRIVREELRTALADVRRPSSWLNAKTAAAYLDTTDDALRALVRRGQLIAHRSAVGTVRFLREDLDEHARAGG